MNKDIKKPVTLITGYLGAGKTTLMNEILKNSNCKGVAVIVNDIGKINIDASLLKNSDVFENDTEMIELQNGCICCTLRDTFMKQIEQLSQNQNITKIIVEASGVSSPSAIGLSFEDYKVSHKNSNVYLDSIVTVVDADRIYTEFLGEINDSINNKNKFDKEDPDIINLIIDQIEFCNIIVLNKCDLLTSEAIKKVHLSLNQLQTEAEIIECKNCKINPDKIFGHNFNYEKVLNSSLMERTISHKNNDKNADKDEFGISSFIFEERRPFNRKRFNKFLEKDFPVEIIRSKGYIWFSDDNIHTQLFEQAGRNASINEVSNWVAALPPEEQKYIFENFPETKENWDDAFGDRLNQIVFIGKNYSKEKISTILMKCIDKKIK